MRKIGMCLALLQSTVCQAVPPEPYFDLAVMASQQVGAADGDRVRQAFSNMAHEPSGQRVLQRAAQSLGLPKARGFVAADDHDYANYLTFFKHTRVPVNE